MVSAFANASTSITPRVTALLLQDRTAQRVLATFLGAFIYSLVGIIGLKAGFYGANGRVVLFAMSILVIVLIVVAMLRWISHLTTFGRRDDTHERVEDVARDAMSRRLQAPYMGGHPLTGPIPEDAVAIYPDKTGYVCHIDMEDLQELAKAAGAQVYLAVVSGKFRASGGPFAVVGGCG